jgi:hypothetical protein
MHQLPFAPQEDSWYTVPLEAELTSGATGRLEGFRSNKKSNDLITLTYTENVKVHVCNSGSIITPKDKG